MHCEVRAIDVSAGSPPSDVVHDTTLRNAMLASLSSLIEEGWKFVRNVCTEDLTKWEQSTDNGQPVVVNNS